MIDFWSYFWTLICDARDSSERFEGFLGSSLCCESQDESLRLTGPGRRFCGAVLSRQGNNLELTLRYASEIKAISPWRKANKKLPELWLLGE